MVRLGQIPVILLALAAIGSGQVIAQSDPSHEASRTAKVKVVPPAVASGPFPIAETRTTSVPSIEYRQAEQLSESDRLLVANDESSVAEHAETDGFDLSRGRWTYEQIICPAFPNHLFLRYMQNHGVDDVSLFSASIPRFGQGRVRIIPIQKRSYSLFSPAPVNAITISAFNHIRAEEGAGASSSWVANGLCYAALAGARPQLTQPEQNAGTGSAMTAILQVQIKGGQVIRFVDANAKPRPMEWSMTFDAHGKLIKATHNPAPEMSERPVPESAGRPATQVVPSSTDN
jgi:hypothetical protein